MRVLADAQFISLAAVNTSDSAGIDAAIERQVHCGSACRHRLGWRAFSRSLKRLTAGPV
jgi:hypothetical protein